MTGGLFATPLPSENVSLWSYDGTAWQTHGRTTTDAMGAYDLDSTGFTIPAKQALFSILEADGSCAEHFSLMLPPGSKVVVTDIDATLTTDDNQNLMEIPDATYVPMMMGHANTMLQAWDAKGYPVIYLTARPHVERVESRVWLRDEMFPTGPLITATDVEEPAAYKTLWLKRMVNDFGWTVVAAYGNAQTDIDAYNNVGIPKADTFIVGPLARHGRHAADSMGWTSRRTPRASSRRSPTITERLPLDLADDVLRLLVAAHALKRRVAQPAVLGPLAELDLDDELRLDPVRARPRCRAWRLRRERGGLALERGAARRTARSRLFMLNPVPTLPA